MDRYFCFRFDVDTHRCVRQGVPNLLALAADLDARFTFFVNMGRAVSRTHTLRRRIRRGGERAEATAAKLPATAKLGVRDTLIAAIANPRVGAGAPHVLQDAAEAGHELGLHGGANHAAWQAAARTWSGDRLRAEITAARDSLETIVGERPDGFASPGWTSPSPLPRILEELGFRYMADDHGPNHDDVRIADGTERLLSVPTAITAEPGGVAYLENLAARGLHRTAFHDDLRRRLAHHRLAVVYDHPYFAGVQALERVRDAVHIARDLGFDVVRLDQAVSALHPPGRGADVPRERLEQDPHK
ncbi:MAG: polysaccharide deacetylase family protein [Longimicrobiales bacterium]|nr:polysaccharide deacetylase family protein [Longimicrobiales bacterium]